MIAKLSDKITVGRKYDCHNRRRDALKLTLIVPNGFREDGTRRYRTIRTDWNGAASGVCQYARTSEGKGDVRCAGCMRGVE